MWLKRARYFVAKAAKAWSDGTLREKVPRFLASSIRIPVGVTIAHLRLPRADRKLDVAAGFADHRHEPRHCRSNPDHLRRIVAAYQAAKQAQKHAAPAFEIRGLWSEWIHVNHRALIQALDTENLPALSALFENLQREPFTIGTGSSYDEYVRYRTSLTGRFYVRAVWCRYRDIFRSLGAALDDLHHPYVGNPAGISLHGDVVQCHTFRHAYHAREMREWLRDVPGAVVAEIGGGIGGQACQTLRRAGASIAKYLLFDIAEVASISAYFLLCAFPDKRIRLFGEGPVSTDGSEDYDIGVFPHFETARLADDSVDLFHNACSFSEMDGVSATAYLRIIERACRRYFSHVNHDTRFTYRNPDGSVSTNILGSELIPDPGRFKRVFKKPRVFCLPEDRCFPAYEYLYERISPGSSPRGRTEPPEDGSSKEKC